MSRLFSIVELIKSAFVRGALSVKIQSLWRVPAKSLSSAREKSVSSVSEKFVLSVSEKWVFQELPVQEIIPGSMTVTGQRGKWYRRESYLIRGRAGWVERCGVARFTLY